FYAGVALGMVERGWAGVWWPTYFGEPFDKPPLVLGLIALSMKLFGMGEFAVRLPAALLSAACVPMLYLVARRLFSDRWPALLSALVLLTLLSVVRHGRVAMLDAPSVAFMLAMTWLLLRAMQDDPCWAWPSGAALAA